MLTANPLKRRIIRLAAIGGSILALGAALVGLAAASASASANQTSACNGCHGTAGSSEINISTDVTAKTVVAGSTFTIAASYTNGGTGQTQINWPTSFSNIGITRDNTLFNPTPRYSTAAIAATGSLTSTLTAPATAGTYSVRVYAAGKGPWVTDWQDITVTVTAATTPVSITTTSLPNGTTGVYYSQTLAASGGTALYTWAISAGNLPDGLGLNASIGVISGTPTTAGTSSFTVSVADSAQSPATDTQALSITIAAVVGTPPPADTVGPVTSSASISPRPSRKNPVAAVTLTAVVDDSTTGGSNIKSASYSLDGGAAVDMVATDGAFDEVREDVTATVSLAGLSTGRHMITISGTDAKGNTGNVVKVRFRIAVSAALQTGRVRISTVSPADDDEEMEADDLDEEGEEIEAEETETDDEEIVIWIGTNSRFEEENED